MITNRYTGKITKIIEENYRIKTIITDIRTDAKPGQFGMIWIPGENEKPFSFASSNPVIFTIAKIGPFSEKLHKLREGDEITFTGPLGNGFELRNYKRILLVGGGYGVVPLYFLQEEAKRKGISTTGVIGARTKKDLIYLDKIKGAHPATDDGTCGFKGNAVQLAEKLIEESKGEFDAVFSCGPEPMMKALYAVCRKNGLPLQVSLERVMKCGIGLCGSCVINGKRVCKEGPVFDAEEVFTNK